MLAETHLLWVFGGAGAAVAWVAGFERAGRRSVQAHQRLAAAQGQRTHLGVHGGHVVRKSLHGIGVYSGQNLSHGKVRRHCTDGRETEREGGRRGEIVLSQPQWKDKVAAVTKNKTWNLSTSKHNGHDNPDGGRWGHRAFLLIIYNMNLNETHPLLKNLKIKVFLVVNWSTGSRLHQLKI